ncbi:hypothetical protein V1T76_11405 [Roseibium sp. FZY0029]|uniref:hypothetical protein n=1 Tax=Roseibium sp. FZY0029 TaxID=3116647 RepID=UPI002EB5A37F|nr:hypothetical protein [Roseibium sp. FZY0029]
MGFGNVNTDALNWLAIIAGFLAVLAFDVFHDRQALANRPIKSNHGSIMMYVVWQVAIAVFLSETLLGLLYAAYRYLPDAFSHRLPWIAATISFVAGGAYARVAVLRARDAGRGHAVALLGIIPIGNLFLIFLPPREAPERPRYTPSSRGARILVGVLAIAVLVSLGQINSLADGELIRLRVERIAERSSFTAQAMPPTGLVGAVNFEGADIDLQYKAIYYTYRLPEPRSGAKGLEEWLETTMKPASMDAVCAETIVTIAGWHVWYEYYDGDDREVAEIGISRRDCRERALQGNGG